MAREGAQRDQEGRYLLGGDYRVKFSGFNSRKEPSARWTSCWLDELCAGWGLSASWTPDPDCVAGRGSQEPGLARFGNAKGLGRSTAYHSTRYTNLVVLVVVWYYSSYCNLKTIETDGINSNI